MKIFITGATGFIGKRLVERLIAQGHEVTALVRNRDHGLPSSVKTVQGDIARADLISLSGYSCDLLFHLAAMINFDPLRREELKSINEDGTRVILELAEKWLVKRAVVVSSACTIGISADKELILSEDTPVNKALAGRNPYMDSKCGAEKVARTFSERFPVIIVNPTTVYGPGDKTLNSGTLIRTVYLNKIIPVPPGGGNVVDVDDVVEGIISAGEKGVSGKRYILGGYNLSFREILDSIAAELGKKPVWVPIPVSLKKLMAFFADMAGKLTGNRFMTAQIIEDLFSYKYYSNALAKNDLGWSPRFEFKDTLKRAFEYYKREGLL